MGKKVNIRRIAELSGSSASTVSRVLSGKDTDIKISAETRDRIMAVCRELDYQPSIHASRLFSRQSKVIGFLPARDLFIEDDNLARSMSGVYSRLHQAGYRCMPVVYDDNFVSSKEYLNLFKRQEVDALVIWGANESHSWLEELHAENHPFILLANRFMNYPSVTCDQKSGIAAMVKHCLVQGARKFVYVNVGMGDSCQQRHDGFIEAACGNEVHVVTGGIGIQEGLNAVNDILALNPDVVICGNDRLAIGVEQGLIAAGKRIPEDIMITGGDNIELGIYCPVPLTTFDQMSRRCAEIGVDVLVDHLVNGMPLHSEVISPEIHVRRSTLSGQ